MGWTPAPAPAAPAADSALPALPAVPAAAEPDAEPDALPIWSDADPFAPANPVEEEDVYHRTYAELIALEKTVRAFREAGISEL